MTSSSTKQDQERLEVVEEEVKVEEEEVVRMAMDTWKKMAVEEKALWRKKAKEAEDYNKKM